MRPFLLMPNGRFFACLGRGILLLACLAGFETARAAEKGQESVLLSGYPLLSQKDPANYRDQSLLTVKDTVPGGTAMELVPNLAAAATVYTMLEKARGN